MHSLSVHKIGARPVTFSNTGDGLLVAPTAPGNGSRVPVTAPVDGYTSGLQRELSNTPAGGWKDNSTKNQNYYLRVRTALDSNGHVQSALYGKIYGDFTLDPINSKTTWILFTYYLNPTPKSRSYLINPRPAFGQDLNQTKTHDFQG